MAIKWCTKLEVAEKMCPFVFQGRPSNFEVTVDKTITNFNPDWAFPDFNFGLNSPIALKWCTKLDRVYRRSSIKFPGHMDPKINDLNPILSKNTRSVAAIKSPRFAFLLLFFVCLLIFACLFACLFVCFYIYRNISLRALRCWWMWCRPRSPLCHERHPYGR